MKKTTLWLIAVCLIAVSQTLTAQSSEAVAGAKKPTLTVLPSDNWCAARYFMTTYDDQGTEVKIPDYMTAFQQDSELPMVIANVGALLTDYGYSIKDAEQELKAIIARAQEDNVTTSSTSRSYLAESPLDVLKRRVKADILLQIWWKVNKEAIGHSVSFTIEAFDTYTSKRIATYSGTSTASEEIIPRLLANTIRENIATFDRQLTSWYNQMETNGREIVLTVRCWDKWDKNLETEFGDKELTDWIDEWMAANTVNGQYNLTDGTETFAQFEQVMIPLCDANGKALDARAFAVQLQRHLKKEPFLITSKVMIRGLGEAILVLGEK
ncbi:MAG: hypothetical protein IKZ52_10550 [Bacteroidales bacterium]|nr:hypothetical protein [Bacteroidales bacterium]